MQSVFFPGLCGTEEALGFRSGVRWKLLNVCAGPYSYYNFTKSDLSICHLLHVRPNSHIALPEICPYFSRLRIL